jgi:very-short-patch-repair endonuclease
MSTKVVIICKNHNIEFTQSPTNHLHGAIGCPVCNKNVKPRISRKSLIPNVNIIKPKTNSAGEKLIEFWLNKNSIDYEKQKTFDGCKNRRKLRYDFYLPNQNVLIEYDGRQHFVSVKSFGGENGFKTTQINDKIKTEYAVNNGYNLLRIPYTEKESISDVLKIIL